MFCSTSEFTLYLGTQDSDPRHLDRLVTQQIKYAMAGAVLSLNPDVLATNHSQYSYFTSISAPSTTPYTSFRHDGRGLRGYSSPTDISLSASRFFSSLLGQPQYALLFKSKDLALTIIGRRGALFRLPQRSMLTVPALKLSCVGCLRASCTDCTSLHCCVCVTVLVIIYASLSYTVSSILLHPTTCILH